VSNVEESNAFVEALVNDHGGNNGVEAAAKSALFYWPGENLLRHYNGRM
jgi:hypothetical protein